MQITIKMQDNHEMKKNREKNTTRATAMLRNKKKAQRIDACPKCHMQLIGISVFFSRFFEERKKRKRTRKKLAPNFFFAALTACDIWYMQNCKFQKIWQKKLQKSCRISRRKCCEDDKNCGGFP